MKIITLVRTYLVALICAGGCAGCFIAGAQTAATATISRAEATQVEDVVIDAYTLNPASESFRYQNVIDADRDLLYAQVLLDCATKNATVSCLVNGRPRAINHTGAYPNYIYLESTDLGIVNIEARAECEGMQPGNKSYAKYYFCNPGNIMPLLELETTASDGSTTYRTIDYTQTSSITFDGGAIADGARIKVTIPHASAITLYQNDEAISTDRYAGEDYSAGFTLTKGVSGFPQTFISFELENGYLSDGMNYSSYAFNFSEASVDIPETPQITFSDMEDTLRNEFIGSCVANITCRDADAIYYTTDNSHPSATNGTLYTGEITIAETTTIRAIGTNSAGAGEEAVASATLFDTSSVPSTSYIPYEQATEIKYYDRNNPASGKGYIICAPTDDTGLLALSKKMEVTAAAPHADSNIYLDHEGTHGIAEFYISQTGAGKCNIWCHSDGATKYLSANNPGEVTLATADEIITGSLICAFTISSNLEITATDPLTGTSTALRLLPTAESQTLHAPGIIPAADPQNHSASRATTNSYKFRFTDPSQGLPITLYNTVLDNATTGILLLPAADPDLNNPTDPTGTTDPATTTYYDLQGRRVDPSTPGILIRHTPASTTLILR